MSFGTDGSGFSRSLIRAVVASALNQLEENLLKELLDYGKRTNSQFFLCLTVCLLVDI